MAGAAAAAQMRSTACDDEKSDDVTSASARTSAGAADLHLFYLVGWNDGSSAPALLLHDSNRP